jgi:hypothetical protein
VWSKFVLVAGFLLDGLLSCGRAQVPRTIPFQGLLTNTSGQRLDGTYSVTISLDSSEIGGPPLWSETKSSLVSKSAVPAPFHAQPFAPGRATGSPPAPPPCGRCGRLRGGL